MTGTNKRISLIHQHCQNALADYSRFEEECFIENTSGYRCLILSISQIGEIANGLPSEFRAEHEDVPWHEMIALRHRIVHDYETIRMDLLRLVICEDIPVLCNWCEKFLRGQAVGRTSAFGS